MKQKANEAGTTSASRIVKEYPEWKTRVSSESLESEIFFFYYNVLR